MEELKTLNKNYGGSFGKALSLLKKNSKTDLKIVYNLFRLIDGFEDAKDMPKKEKIETFNDLIFFVENKSINPYFIKKHINNTLPYLKENSIDFLAVNDGVEILKDYNSITKINDQKKKLFSKSIKKMINGMIEFLPEDNKIYDKIRTYKEFNKYCLAVGGNTGTIIVDSLFLNNSIDKLTHDILTKKQKDDFSLSESAGIFLQYVNMIKDIKEDENNNKQTLPHYKGENISTYHLAESINESIHFLNQSIHFLEYIKNVSRDARKFLFLSASLYAKRLENFSYNLENHLNMDQTEKKEFQKSENRYAKKIFLYQTFGLNELSLYSVSKTKRNIIHAIQR